MGHSATPSLRSGRISGRNWGQTRISPSPAWLDCTPPVRHGESDQRQITYSDPNTELLPAVAGLSSGTVTAIAASSATAAIAAGIQSGKLGAAFQTGLIAPASAFAFAEVGAATDGDFNAKGFNAAGKSADDYFGT